MKGVIVVHLNDGTAVVGTEHDIDADEVQATVMRFLEAEGQGSLVLEGGPDRTLIFPTRSIQYVSIEPAFMVHATQHKSVASR